MRFFYSLYRLYGRIYPWPDKQHSSKLQVVQFSAIQLHKMHGFFRDHYMYLMCDWVLWEIFIWQSHNLWTMQYSYSKMYRLFFCIRLYLLQDLWHRLHPRLIFISCSMHMWRVKSAQLPNLHQFPLHIMQCWVLSQSIRQPLLPLLINSSSLHRMLFNQPVWHLRSRIYFNFYHRRKNLWIMQKLY